MPKRRRKIKVGSVIKLGKGAETDTGIVRSLNRDGSARVYWSEARSEYNESAGTLRGARVVGEIG